MERKSTVSFEPNSSRLYCKGCDQSIPLSRATMRNQERIIEELMLAENLHNDCGGGRSLRMAMLARRFREGLLREHHSRPDRVVYSV